MNQISWQKSESMEMGILLALTGGVLDAYTYLCRGGVFANAQTGNIVLLGMYLAQGQYSRALKYLIPIAAFAVGIIIAELIKSRFKSRGNSAFHWRQIVILVEIFLLVAVAFLPQSMNTLANVMVSFVCSLQVQTFRKIHRIACATTMCTGNLRNGVEALYRYVRTGEREMLQRGLGYLGVDLVFLVGAAAGTACAFQWQEKAVLVSGIFRLLAFVVMFFQEEENHPSPAP
ncbi:MAG: YoaK family protein [Blautia sp.]